MLKIYNTLTKSKQSFTETEKGKVKIYSCGPTVYSRQTIGNFRTFVFSDTLRRTLEYFGYDVELVMNLTDVGHLTMTEEQKSKSNDTEITDTENGLDRMEKAAKAEQLTVWQVAQKYIDLFLEDYEKLNIKKPKIFPRATENIPEQIEMIKQLFTNGYAYVTKDAVYFDTSKFKDYNQLAGQELAEKWVAVRSEVEADPEKKNPSDFRLWQLNQPDHAMQWDSPWGRGFPGWHIECSAMSLKYLGQPIDIHTGGTDHIAVHHTNEIAQTEAATGKKFVNYWMHGAFLKVDGKRMGKSLGNAYTLPDIVAKGFSPLELRYFYLGAHYRQILNFTWEALESAHNRLQKIRSEVSNLALEAKHKGKPIEDIIGRFKDALGDDLNMPKALALISEIISGEYKPEDKLETLLSLDKVLGLNLEQDTHAEVDREKIEELIKVREKYRAEKNWAESDRIRDQLLNDYSVAIKDEENATTWKLVTK